MPTKQQLASFDDCLSMGHDAHLLTLQLINHKPNASGNTATFAFTNKAPNKTAKTSGILQGISTSVSVFDLNAKTAVSSGSNIRDGKLITVWLNDCDEEMAELIRSEGCDSMVAIFKDGECELLSFEQVTTSLLPKGADDSTSDEASATA